MSIQPQNCSVEDKKKKEGKKEQDKEERKANEQETITGSKFHVANASPAGHWYFARHCRRKPEFSTCRGCISQRVTNQRDSCSQRKSDQKWKEGAAHASLVWYFSLASSKKNSCCHVVPCTKPQTKTVPTQELYCFGSTLPSLHLTVSHGTKKKTHHLPLKRKN